MFERYGGLPFVTRLVLSFYDRVMASTALSPFFAETDMQRLPKPDQCDGRDPAGVLCRRG